jgi:iron complex transport system substrate-binding protein
MGNKIVLAAVCLAALCFLSAGSAAAASLKVRDTLGRTVEIDLPVRRVVALNKNVVEVMRILDVDDRLVGISKWINRTRPYWPELAGVPCVGRFNDPNYEDLAAMKPDVVICYAASPGPELEEKGRLFGFKVLRLDMHRLAEARRGLLILAELFHAEDKAAEFIEWEDAQFAAIARCVARTEERPTVYLEAYGDYLTLGPDTGAADRLTLAGATNIAKDLHTDRALVSPEWIAGHDPYYIVKTTSVTGAYRAEDYHEFIAVRDALAGRPGMGMVRACREKRIGIMGADISAGPRSVVGVAYLARWLHPGECSCLSPTTMHREFMERFHRMTYGGRFAYPPEEPR